MKDMDKRGFTLIELSLVLVIIVLLVGGVMGGKTLVESAQSRQQISQIEQYQTAVKAFQAKYNCLPGDCKKAANFGFVYRGTCPGQGDGNGLITGSSYCSVQDDTMIDETLVFWRDLSEAKLIKESFVTALNNDGPTNTYALDLYFPHSKINNTYVNVFSHGNADYFGVNGMVYMSCNGCNQDPNPAMSVNQAFSIDSKVDDGMPQSGNVMAAWVGRMGANRWYWGGGANAFTNDPGTAQPAQSYTCNDNGNNAAVPATYSTRINGNKVLCSLVFKFQ